jgi:galactonate dehydratase
MAEAAFVGVFPHLMGSPVNIAAFVQFDAAIPNFFLHESHTSADPFNEIVDHPPEREGGYIIVPSRPGIGLEINEAKLSKFPYKPKKITGNFRADGSVIS